MSKKISDQDVKNIAQYLSEIFAISSGGASSKNIGKNIKKAMQNKKSAGQKVSDQDAKNMQKNAKGGKIKKRASGGKIKKRASGGRVKKRK